MRVDDNLSLFKALGGKTRYRIVEVLLRGERCACEIPALIRRRQSNTSMHLAKLTDLGLLKSRRDGKMILYSIKNEILHDIFKVLGYPEVVLRPRVKVEVKR